MDLGRFVGSWQRFVFSNDDSMEGFLVKQDADYGIVPVPGEQGIAIQPNDVVRVEPADSRPPFLARTSGPGKRITAEADLFEFMNRRVRIHWKNGHISVGTLENSIILNGRLALTTPSRNFNEGARSESINWWEIDRIEVAD